MAFTVSPSVIVREVDASAVVPAIATPPGAIAGVFRWGPVNEPILITSEDNLVARFGKPTADNYETFFTAADFLAYANPIWVVRADNGATTANNANNDVDSEFEIEAKYPGDLGNSIDVAYVKGDNFESEVLSVGDVSGNITFNTSSISLTVTNTSSTVDGTSFNNGDKLVIGNDTIGYQELTISNYEFTAANTSTDTDATIDFTIEERFTLPVLDSSELKISRKWGYGYLFGKAPSDNNMHIAIIDNDGRISGETGTVLEIFENLSLTEGDTLDDGRINYFVDVIENFSSWISLNIANTENTDSITVGYESLNSGTKGRTESAATLQT